MGRQLKEPGQTGQSNKLSANIELSDNMRATKEHGKNLKFFVFDRDDTLIDSKDQLINKKRILNILETISNDPNSSWAIASAGSIALTNDSAFLAIKKKSPNIKPPSYVQFARGINGLLNRLDIINYVDCESREKERLGNLKHWALNVALNGTVINGVETDNQFSVRLERPEVKFTFNNDTQVRFQIGQTFYTMNLKQLRENIASLEKGDFKLFFIFDALDKAQLKLTLEDCPGLIEFGITEISAPKEYSPIATQNIILCDDKPDCVALASKAGFVGIDADTNCSSKWENSRVHDTYLDKLDWQCFELTINNVRRDILNGIEQGHFKTGFFGMTGVPYTYMKNNKEHTVNIPHTISALLNMSYNNASPELLGQMIDAAKITLTRRPSSTLFFHRPPAAQSIYEKLNLIKLPETNASQEEDSNNPSSF